MNKPLAGLRLLDLTHMLSGPYAAMILADLGAETIKVEPLQGEGTRALLASDPENSLCGMGVGRFHAGTPRERNSARMTSPSPASTAARPR